MLKGVKQAEALIRVKSEELRVEKLSKATLDKCCQDCCVKNQSLSLEEKGSSCRRKMSLTTAGEGERESVDFSLPNESPTPKLLTQFRPSPHHREGRNVAFTLAEVLITLGVIGVVAAVTLPVLMTNVQARVQKEQVRSAKYKLTLATDKMKSLGLLGEQYGTIEAGNATENFIEELKKHYKIAKVCKNDELRKCWPTDKIEVPTQDGGVSAIDVNDLKTGSDLKSLGLGTKNTETMGMITADGVSMILTYSPNCTPLDQARTYSWSTIDNKPETNATTNCISAIMDVNGKAKPNRLGKDVRTWNSILGYVRYSATKLSYDECMQQKDKLGIKECYSGDDYWAGAVWKCNQIGLHLPSTQALANIAGVRYGISNIDSYTLVMSNAWARNQTKTGGGNYTDCKEWYIDNNQDYDRVGHSDNIICTYSDIPNNINASIAIADGHFWSSNEVSNQGAISRGIYGNNSSWFLAGRDVPIVPLCVGD